MGRGDGRINPVSRFYDFLKKKSQAKLEVYMPFFSFFFLFTPSLSLPCTVHVGHSVQLNFLRFYRFFPPPSFVPDIQAPGVFHPIVFKVIGDRSPPCESLE